MMVVAVAPAGRSKCANEDGAVAGQRHGVLCSFAVVSGFWPGLRLLSRVVSAPPYTAAMTNRSINATLHVY